MKRLTLLLACLLVNLVARTGKAEREYSVEGSRIQLGAIVANLSSAASELDLGPSPKAGSSRLVTKDELNRALKAIGEPETATDSVRVVRATKRWTQQELSVWLSPAVQSALPSHAALVQLETPRVHLAVATAVIGHIEVARLPRRRGTVHSTAVVELNVDGKLDQRLSLPVILELDDPPKPAIVERGQTLRVSVALGQTHVSAIATTMQTAQVGTIALCRVLKTKKVLRARLLSADAAEVVAE